MNICEHSERVANMKNIYLESYRRTWKLNQQLRCHLIEIRFRILVVLISLFPAVSAVAIVHRSMSADFLRNLQTEFHIGRFFPRTVDFVWLNHSILFRAFHEPLTSLLYTMFSVQIQN